MQIDAQMKSMMQVVKWAAESQGPVILTLSMANKNDHPIWQRVT
jgi:hypothetical protein